MLRDFIDEGVLALAKDAGFSFALDQKALYGNVKAMKKIKNYPLDKITTQGQAVEMDKLMALLVVQQDNIQTARTTLRQRQRMTRAKKAYNKIKKKVPDEVETKLTLAKNTQV